jgi:hypothetical protein
MYAEATLFVTVNATHISLEANPTCYVLCALQSISAPRDSTQAILQEKYHSHVNELYIQILENYKSEINLLQSLSIYSVRNGKHIDGIHENFNICDKLLTEKVIELKPSTGVDINSHRQIIVFIEKYEAQYLKASEAYMRVLTFVDINCERGKSAYMNELLSQHIALKQHIRSQLVTFLNNKNVVAIEQWRLLCLQPGNCVLLIEGFSCGQAEK